MSSHIPQFTIPPPPDFSFTSSLTSLEHRLPKPQARLLPPSPSPLPIPFTFFFLFPFSLSLSTLISDRSSRSSSNHSFSFHSLLTSLLTILTFSHRSVYQLPPRQPHFLFLPLRYLGGRGYICASRYKRALIQASIAAVLRSAGNHGSEKLNLECCQYSDEKEWTRVERWCGALSWAGLTPLRH